MWCVWFLWEKNTNKTYDYLNKNQLLLKQIDKDSIPEKELNKIIEKIKKMYLKKDNKLIKILKLIS